MGRCRQVGTAFAKRRQSLSKAASLLQRGNELSPGVVSDSHGTKSIQQTSADKKDDMMIRRFWKNWKGVKRFCKRMTSAEWKNTARLKRVCKSGLRNCDNILSSAFASGRPVSINLQQLRHCVFQKYKCLDAQEIIHLQ